MQPKELRRLLDVLKETDVSEMTLETGEYKLTLRRGALAQAQAPQVVYAVPSPTAGHGHQAVDQHGAGQAHADGPTPRPAPQPETRAVDVTAPIVGTFYAAPSPDAPPFVKVGDRVKAGAVLCIIEAMKLMNEIEAETAGVVREVLVENGQPVEYGQALFRIEPD